MVWEFPSCSESAHIAVKPCYLDRIAFLFGDNYVRTHSAQAGDAAPAFSAPGLDGEPVTLESFAGRGLVLYFYPKDNTAGCTLEAQGFRDHLADFEALGYAVAGVSRDSVKSHCGFRDRQNLNFPLLADKEEVVCTAYGVMKEKMMYGRLCRGIERSTFVISPEGRILHALYGVKAKPHVEELLALLKA